MAKSEEVPREGVSATRTSLAADLEKWGKDSGCEDDPFIKRIARALRSGQDESNWATSDFFATLPEPESDNPKGLRRRIRSIAEAIRGALVFSPVLITWFDLRETTREYRDFLEVSDSEVSFLVFWTDRGLPTTALWVVAVIGIAILLGLGLDVWTESTSRPSREVERIRRDLAVRLTDAFRPKQKVDLTNVEQSLVATINDFKNSASTIRDATERMHDVWKSTDSLGPQLERVSAGMAEIAQQISGSMAQSIAQLHKEVATLTESITQIERKMTDQVDNRIDDASKKLVGAAAGIEASSRTIQLVINAVYDELNRVHSEPDRLRRERDLPRSEEFPHPLQPDDDGSDGSDSGNEFG